MRLDFLKTIFWKRAYEQFFANALRAKTFSRSRPKIETNPTSFMCEAMIGIAPGGGGHGPPGGGGNMGPGGNGTGGPGVH